MDSAADPKWPLGRLQDPMIDRHVPFEILQCIRHCAYLEEPVTFDCWKVEVTHVALGSSVSVFALWILSANQKNLALTRDGKQEAPADKLFWNKRLESKVKG